MVKRSLPRVPPSIRSNWVARPSIPAKATTCSSFQYPFLSPSPPPPPCLFSIGGFLLNLYYGLGFGSVLCRAERVTDGMISAAARALASCTYTFPHFAFFFLICVLKVSQKKKRLKDESIPGSAGFATSRLRWLPKWSNKPLKRLVPAFLFSPQNQTLISSFSFC